MVDNFSQKILSVSDKVCVLMRREKIGEALKELKNEDELLVLLIDGGLENSWREYLDSVEGLPIPKSLNIDF